MNKIAILLFCFLTFEVFSFPIPKDNEVSFDIIRKNKTIGSVVTSFIQNDETLNMRTIVDINVKILFFPAYKFFQDTTETWVNDEFIEINGYTDFEDEREYYINGIDKNNKFFASGMDGELVLDNKILPLNYWNKKILDEEEVFDTQKGIVRKIIVNKEKNEIIEINDEKIETEKYTLDASKNPKDKGPFPTYTIWYKGDELNKFEFKNWKDKKTITTIRNDLSD